MKIKSQGKLIILAGGDTGGPVAPLLAVAEAMRSHHTHVDFLFVGTKWGVEKQMAKAAGMSFLSIPAGKLRRYFSLANLFMPLVVLLGIWRAGQILREKKPVCVIGAGGFVQVPVCLAAWLQGIPIFLHQQDVAAGLANKICAPLARKITVAVPDSVTDFPHAFSLRGLDRADRVVWTGNPTRKFERISRKTALEHFRFDPDLPTLCVMGGGSGAAGLNRIIFTLAPELVKFFNVLHLTGKGKGDAVPTGLPHYRTLEFTSMDGVYAVADVFLCRAGMSTLSELAAARKPAILMPLPTSHQEKNALYFNDQGAVLLLPQNLATAANLLPLLRSLVLDTRLQKSMTETLAELLPADAAERVAKVVWDAM